MKFIDLVEQVQEFGEVIFNEDQEVQWKAYKEKAAENGYQRYNSNSGYQPYPLPEEVKMTPPNRGSSVQPPKMQLPTSKYNHLINELDWYKQRMEQYREFIYWIEDYLKNLDSIEAEAYYKNISSEFNRRF